MALSDYQDESDLYIGWLNTKSAVSNFLDAMSNYTSQSTYLQGLTGYSGSVSTEESDYIAEIQTMIDDFITALPTQPS